jgi:hypothetical protein
MKKGAVLAFIVLFTVCMFHFYFEEDHCPVHCPSRGGGLVHAHPHHGGASVCLCFWTSLAGPETDDFQPAGGLLAFLPPPAADPIIMMAIADITPPPRSSLV